MPNIFSKIFSSAAKETIGEIGGVIDNLSTTDAEKNNAKAQLSEIVIGGLTSVVEAQRDVLKTELQGNFLQRTWRPLLMLIFAGIVIAKWFGWTDESISNELELRLLDTIQLGLGGYVIGRSVEKVTDKVTKNIDLPFIRRKDRAEHVD